MTTHDECSFGGEWVRCDRCGHEYVCKPESDYYCTPDGDHCCEPCLIGDHELHVIDPDLAILPPIGGQSP